MKKHFLNLFLPCFLAGFLLVLSSCPDVESEPVCGRTFYIEGYVDEFGNDCFFGIHVYKWQGGFWVYQFPLFNETEFTAPVNYNEFWRFDVAFCDNATECVSFYLYESDCVNVGENQIEFSWLGCPPSNPTDKLVIEKNLLDYQGHKVCDLCPD